MSAALLSAATSARSVRIALALDDCAGIREKQKRTTTGATIGGAYLPARVSPGVAAEAVLNDSGPLWFTLATVQ